MCSCLVEMKTCSYMNLYGIVWTPLAYKVRASVYLHSEGIVTWTVVCLTLDPYLNYCSYYCGLKCMYYVHVPQSINNPDDHQDKATMLTSPDVSQANWHTEHIHTAKE